MFHVDPVPDLCNEVQIGLNVVRSVTADRMVTRCLAMFYELMLLIFSLESSAAMLAVSIAISICAYDEDTVTTHRLRPPTKFTVIVQIFEAQL